jgi:hypothetical protein
LEPLLDVYALNFSEYVNDGSLPQPAYTTRAQIVGATDNDGQSWLCFLDATGRIQRSKDARNFTQGAHPTGSFETYVDTSGEQGYVLMVLDKANGRTLASLDAGASWPTSFNLPTPALFDRIGYSAELALWFAAGATAAGGAKSPPVGSTPAWTAFVAPWDVSGCIKIVPPRAVETGHGVLFLPANNSFLGIYYTLDGVAFSANAIAGASNIVDGCWSEYHQAWFILTSTGSLYSAATLNGVWALAQTFANAGGLSTYRKILPVGRNLMVIGDRVAGASSSTIGSVTVVSNLADTAGKNYTVDGGGHEEAFFFDGRVVLARVEAGPEISLALGMRL